MQSTEADELVRYTLIRARRTFGVASAAYVHLGPGLVVVAHDVCGDETMHTTFDVGDRWQQLVSLVPDGTNGVIVDGSSMRRADASATSLPARMVATARVDGRVVGYLSVSDDGVGAAPFDGDDLLMLQMMARGLGIGVQRLDHSPLDQVDHLEAELNVNARRDQVTGLANDLGLLEQLVDEMVPLGARRLALLVLRLGPEAWPADPLPDELVRVVARRLRRCVRATDRVTRPLPSEFALITPAPDGERDAIAVGHRLLAALESPVTLDGRERHLDVSIGICLSTGISDPNVMIDRAVRACRSAGSSDSQRIVLAVP